MGRTISYKGFTPASERASAAARGTSRQADTAPELLLRRALWKLGLRYRKNVKTLPGKPDIVFKRKKVVIFCDGDFWHGRDWEKKKEKLKKGSNSSYWVSKIERNMERDQMQTKELEKAGWKVLRFWESDIKNDLDDVVDVILNALSKNTRGEK